MRTYLAKLTRIEPVTFSNAGLASASLATSLATVSAGLLRPTAAQTAPKTSVARPIAAAALCQPHLDANGAVNPKAKSEPDVEPAAPKALA
mmetsp:Transcript_118022/g.328097  ORF Transcript_118022/g.328097 Transcript_118022/m.328097 type:complete len:91 (+) Transcript_118022:833-1105(+)